VLPFLPLYLLVGPSVDLHETDRAMDKVDDRFDRRLIVVFCRMSALGVDVLSFQLNFFSDFNPLDSVMLGVIVSIPGSNEHGLAAQRLVGSFDRHRFRNFHVEMLVPPIVRVTVFVNGNDLADHMNERAFGRAVELVVGKRCVKVGERLSRTVMVVM
jgi:hypothetical protein